MRRYLTWTLWSVIGFIVLTIAITAFMKTLATNNTNFDPYNYFSLGETVSWALWLSIGYILFVLGREIWKGKPGFVTKMILVVSVAAVGWYAFMGNQAEKTWGEVQKGAAGLFLATEQEDMQRPDGKVERLAQWEKPTENGLPAHQWSMEVRIPAGCSVDFVYEDGTHIVEYRFYNMNWIRYVLGTSPDMSHFRYMLIKKGVTEVPYVLTC